MEGTQHSGPRFTWSIGASPETKKFAGLERALCNIQWSTEFAEARINHINFEQCLTSNWKKDTPLYPLIDQLASALNAWNKNVFGNLFHQKNQIQTRLKKSRVEAINDGNQNTHDYHLSTIVTSRIVTLQDAQGNWIIGDDNVQAMVRDFFRSLFTKEEGHYHNHLLPRGEFPPLSEDDLLYLEQTFTTTKVEKLYST
ncbi:hypothetical protein Cgig2_012680 [Carnegiea gigantea]|uniref:Uncharacterized protein n=1 Tax=Carnegiea gigantea TaxID=171969 RepID=A0A9Q1JZQ7_9CARY|nr:hypothetical protein Cgig2_012680 [Carnegiea gigantea]